MKKWILLLLTFVMLIFCSCGKSNTHETEPPTEKNIFSVCFDVQGSVFSRQDLTAEELPKQFDVYLVDGEVTGWTDSNGEPVDPFSICVEGDTTYYAVVRPALSKHEPYLFVNSDGLLCPDDSLTEQDLSQALYALATAEAQSYFPQLPDGDNAVTWEDLTAQLCYFFEDVQVLEAFPQAESVSRSEFARGMNQLLGRGDSESFTLPDGHNIPIDVITDAQAVDALLEAVVSHTPSEQGLTWSQVKQSSAHEPGFVNVNGWLYYVKEDGGLLKGEALGTLYFGPDGRYTCSDPELDQIVVDLLSEMIAANPDADRFELLRVIYDHCHKNYTYRRIYDGNPLYGATGWEIGLAKEMFTTGKGNCYSFAAIFWALARGIGYEARAISGQCLGDRQPHSWCMIEMDGEDYIFDPEWQYAYTERGVFKYDMFKIPLDKATYWRYRWEK